MKKSILLVLLGTALLAPTVWGYTETKPSNYPPDNTGRNTRDVQGGPLTPEDQSNKQADLDLTQEIRKAITSDSSLSVNAQNIKIMTVNGVTTLRGPVKTNQEKDQIYTKAKAVAGVKQVINQLEVIHH